MTDVPKGYAFPEYEQHPFGKMLPPMEDGDFWLLTKDIKVHGLRDTITVYQGKVLDGWHRYRALGDLGGRLGMDIHGNGGCVVEPKFEEFKGTKAQALALVVSRNIHRRHLATAEQRRDLIAELLKAMPEKSDRQIGKQIGADHKTVGAIRAKKEARGEIPHIKKRTDTRGRQQPAKRAAKGKADKPAEATALVWEKDGFGSPQATTSKGCYSIIEVGKHGHLVNYLPDKGSRVPGQKHRTVEAHIKSVEAAKAIAQADFEKYFAPAPTTDATPEPTREEILAADKFWAVNITDKDIALARNMYAVFTDEERTRVFVETLKKAIDAAANGKKALVEVAMEALGVTAAEVKRMLAAIKKVQK